MAVGNWTAYSNAVFGLGTASFNFVSDTLVCVLLTNSYTPVANSDTHWSDISANEVATGSGYTAGGVVLGSISYTRTGGVSTLTSGAASWSTFTASFRYAVIVQRAGGSLAGSDLLLSYTDCNTGGGNLTGDGGTLSLTMNSAGILTVTHSP